MGVTEEAKRTQKKVRKIKRKVVIPLLVILTGIFVYTTADVQKEVLSMFLGTVAGFSLLTVIFFIANWVKDETWKETVKPYLIVFGLLLFWSIVFTAIRLVFKF